MLDFSNTPTVIFFPVTVLILGDNAQGLYFFCLFSDKHLDVLIHSSVYCYPPKNR